MTGRALVIRFADVIESRARQRADEQGTNVDGSLLVSSKW